MSINKDNTLLNSIGSLEDITEFLSKYIATLMGSGVHTSRVVRNSRRIAQSLDVTLNISVFHRTVILTVVRDCEPHHTKIVDIPSLPINFRWNSELSALSWEAYDERLALNVIRDKYDGIIGERPIDPLFVMLMAGAANASFCQLFGGDWLSSALVFFATLTGFVVRRVLQRKQVDAHFAVIVSSFVASILASISVLFDTTADIAITTSVLFLIPGVPLINGVIDIAEGYVLCGFARLTKAALVILSIAIGLYLTLWIVKSGLI